MLSYFQREEPRHSRNQSKAKSNSKSVNNFVSNACDSLTIFWTLPRGLGHLSSPALLSSEAQQAPLCAAAVLGNHPMVLASPKCWGLLLQPGCTFNNGLPWPLPEGTTF